MTPALGCARSGLASHAVARAVLSGAAMGHDQVRDGSGWNHGALGHAHTQASVSSSVSSIVVQHQQHALRAASRLPAPCACMGQGVETSNASQRHVMKKLPSAISTARLQSVTGGPPAAYRPAGLAGALLTQGDGKAHLGAGFPLRCCQRLSLPDVATRRCLLPDNRHTSGLSSPVLSY